MARRKSKELKENEDDLLFYLEYWQEFPDTHSFKLKKIDYGIYRDD